VVSCLESSCTALAAPGLINDTALARSIGAATTKNAPAAIKPRTFVPFIVFLLDIFGYHARAVPPISSISLAATLPTLKASDLNMN
jgi:hypothetical protein